MHMKIQWQTVVVPPTRSFQQKYQGLLRLSPSCHPPPPHFFVQANYGAMQQCLTAVAAAVPKNSSVLELYAGSGVIGLALAAAGVARRVVCVEINPAAAQSFRASVAKLADSNKDAATRVTHVTASAGDAAALKQLLAQHYGKPQTSTPTAAAAAAAATAAAAAGPPDVLVVDPPRKGLDAPLMALLTQQAVVSSSSSSSSSSSGGGGGGGSSSSSSSSVGLGSVKRLVYLSCGFDALRSDADALLAAGWRVCSAQGFLFFPGTDTIETLAVFERD
jgi:tRNA/tmRNA/rRNA uracil-C5-methylase (TrmA/RlmC/RlmD family)